MRATIKMLAERAGVSIGTVDRVLHDRPYVKEEVRRRVLQAMEELEYRPNRMASALATSGTSRRFVLVLPRFADYVRQALGAGTAQFQAERADYNLRVEMWEYGQEDCLGLLDRLLEDLPQGVALCAADSPSVRARLVALAESGVPVVTLNSDIPNSRRLCFVGEDARRVGRIAGEIAAKFCHPGDPILVAYAGPAYEQHKARVDGFFERLVERGISREQCRLVQTHNEEETTRQVVAEALEILPDLRCIYMANLSVPACARALDEAGKLGRVHVLCHDSTPEICALLRSGAVDFTIGQDLRYQSYQALRVLFDAVLNRRLPETECFTPPSPILSAENC